jgi:hypothetical protein
MKDNVVCSEVIINNDLGLHARPAALLAKEAGKYKSEIIFVQIYPCITKNSVTDKYDIKANSYITYNLVCNRRKNDNRSLDRVGCIPNSRVFCRKKT